MWCLGQENDLFSACAFKRMPLNVSISLMIITVKYWMRHSGDKDKTLKREGVKTFCQKVKEYYPFCSWWLASWLRLSFFPNCTDSGSEYPWIAYLNLMLLCRKIASCAQESTPELAFYLRMALHITRRPHRGKYSDIGAVIYRKEQPGYPYQKPGSQSRKGLKKRRYAEHLENAHCWNSRRIYF